MKEKLQMVVEVVKANPVKFAVIGLVVIGGAIVLTKVIGHPSVEEAESFVETVMES